MLMPRIGVKPLLSAGFLGGAVGLFLASGIDVHSSYVGEVLPGMIVLGLFSGISFPASGNAALHEVTRQDASLASGVQSATQAIGGALGLSCLVTLALRHASSQVREGVLPSVASTQGYALAFQIGAVLRVIGGVVVLALLEHVIATPRNAQAEITAAPLPAGEATSA
ncbi:MAG: hypothetical protein QOG59_122 [Solirubrobacteraceae bacterium]|nr:hypothetical protein [Solirubrobacteraceae bacterium]